MKTLTLRRKFRAGFATVAMVALVVAWSNRLMGMSVRFHYDERNHLAHLMRVDAALNLVAYGAPAADQPGLGQLLDEIDAAIEIHVQDDAALTIVEKQAYHLSGYGGVFDLAAQGYADLVAIRATLASAPGQVLNRELAGQVRPFMQHILADSVRWGEVLAESVRFFNRLVSLFTYGCLALLGVTFYLLRRSVLGPVDRAVQRARMIAAGDLRGAPVAHGADEIGDLLCALNDMNARLTDIAGGVRQSTVAVREVAGDVVGDNAQLAERTASQSISLKEMAASMAALTAGVVQNTSHAEHANRQAISALETASAGGAAIAQVVANMSGIMAASDRIADITGVIDGIAFQTNILALNAAVESACAGEAGRGFAVIAAEVRNLAQRSASAAKEIKGLIADSAQRVAAGAALVDHAGATMAQIAGAIDRVTGSIGGIAAAGQTQSAGIEQASRAVLQMEEFTRQNGQLVRQARVAVANLEDQADALATTVSVFRVAGAHAGNAAAAAANAPPRRAPSIAPDVAAPVRLQ